MALSELARGMVGDFSKVFESLHECVPAVIDSDFAMRMRRLFRDVPATCSEDIVFEQRLDDESIDLAVSIRLTHDGLEWLQAVRRWPQAAELLAAVYPRPLPSGPMPWLEFDCDASREPTPSLYVGVDRSDGDDEALRDTISRLSSDPTGTAAIARRCIAALPRDVRTVYVGAMTSRATAGVRLNVQALDRPSLVTYLDAIGWPGLTDAVDACVVDLEARSGRYAAQLDLTSDGILPRLGVEIARSSPLGSPQPDDVAETLDRLATRGLCGPSVLQRLAAWPMAAISNLERVFAVLNRPAVATSANRFERAYNHVKIVFESDRQIRAKIYLAACRYGS